MPNLKIAYSPKVEQYFSTNRELVEIAKTDFTDVAAIVLSSSDVGEYLDRIQATKFGVPVFVVQTEEQQVDPKFYDSIYHIQDLNGYDIKLYSRQIETASKLYEEKMLPPFFKMLSEYVEMGNIAFDCRDIKVVNTIVNIQQVVSFMTSTVKTFSVRIFVMRT